ncbi:MAG: hypothetical protein U0457_13570 [Candidatus Sericytochromatia bacterium]
MENRDKIENSIESFYSLDSLLRLYKDYFKQFEPNPNVKLEHKGTTNSDQKLQKKELARIFTNIISSDVSFNELMSNLPNDVKKVFEKITWSGIKYTPEELDKDLEVKILIKEPKINLNPLFSIICSEKISGITPGSFEYKLFLPDELRKATKKYLSHPEFYNIIPVGRVEELTEFTFISNGTLIKDISIYNNYVTKDNITFSKQDKPSPTSIRNMKDFCEISEFYEATQDKNLENLRTELIISFFKNFHDKNDDNNLMILRKALYALVEGDHFLLDSLINHIKGKSELKNSKDYESRNITNKKELLTLIKNMPEGEWVSLENIASYCSYRDLNIHVFDLDVSNYLYFEETKSGASKYSFTQKTNIKQENINDVVFMPMLKGFFFLLSAVGLFDMAYDSAYNHIYKQKNIDYLSPYDGLKYVRLNDFGAYVLGKKEALSEDLTATDEDAEEGLKIELNNDFLLMKVEGKDKFKTALIDKISKKLSENIYQVTEETFLSSCNNIDEIKDKIEKLKNQIEDVFPKVWSDFFRKLLDKASSVETHENIKIFSSKDNDFNKLLLHQKELYNLVLKVEEGFFAIKEENIPELKSILKKYGYLLF